MWFIVFVRLECVSAERWTVTHLRRHQWLSWSPQLSTDLSSPFCQLENRTPRRRESRTEKTQEVWSETSLDRVWCWKQQRWWWSSCVYLQTSNAKKNMSNIRCWMNLRWEVSMSACSLLSTRYHAFKCSTHSVEVFIGLCRMCSTLQ